MRCYSACATCGQQCNQTREPFLCAFFDSQHSACFTHPFSASSLCSFVHRESDLSHILCTGASSAVLPVPGAHYGRRNSSRARKPFSHLPSFQPPYFSIFLLSAPPNNALQKYHGTLLFWARHATIAPRTSDDRLTTVFPKGRLHPNSPKFRLENDGLTYKKIFDAFVLVMDDLEDSKSFINANIDLVPSKLFLRALTAQKLSAQSNNELEQMDFIKEVRRRYILASDQVFFPLNIEVQKAETRVMTYLARDELRSFAENWDEVQCCLVLSCFTCEVLNLLGAVLPLSSWIQ